MRGPALLRCAAAALCACATPAQAASALDFDVWMRAIDARSVAVQKHIAAGDTPAAEDDARELERLYALTQDWFARDGASADAVAIALDGRALAASIPASLAARDLEHAALSARGIARACNDCHDNYKPFK